jgi:hypothetical protein
MCRCDGTTCKPKVQGSVGKSFRSGLGKMTSIAASNPIPSNPIRHPKIKDKLMLQREEDYKQNPKKEKEKLVRPGAGSVSRVVEVILTKTGDKRCLGTATSCPPRT